MLFESVNLKEKKILKSYANHIHMMPIRLSDERAVRLCWTLSPRYTHHIASPSFSASVARAGAIVLVAFTLGGGVF